MNFSSTWSRVDHCVHCRSPVSVSLGNGRDIPYTTVANDPAYAYATPGTYDMSIVVPNISISYKF